MAALSGSFTPSTASVNLTAGGWADWASWNYLSGDATSDPMAPTDRKSGGGSTISSASGYNTTGQLIKFDDMGILMSWTDGTVHASASDPGAIWNNQNGGGTDNAGYGFSLTLPAGTAERVARVWCSCWQGSMEVIGVLSDASATMSAAYVEGDPGAGVSIPGYFEVTYSAGSDGQTLEVRILQALPCGGYADVEMAAAAWKFTSAPGRTVTASQTAAATTQVATVEHWQPVVPDSDDSVGGWSPSTGSTLYGVLADDDNSTYAYASSNTTMRVGLSTPAVAPATGEAWFQVLAQGYPNKGLQARLVEGASTVRGSLSTGALPGLDPGYLPAALATGIVDFSDLSVECEVVNGAVSLTPSVTYSSSGGSTYNNSSPLGVPYPGVSLNSMLLLIIGMKPSSAGGGSVTTPSGWNLVTSLTNAGGYGATLGADTGNTNIYIYSRVSDGTESGTLSVAVSGANVVCGGMHRFITNMGVDAPWSVAGVTGSDTTAGSVSVTFGSDPGVTAGDLVLGAMIIPTDVTTPSQFSAEAFTQTGVTFSTVVERGEFDTIIGNQLGGFVITAEVSSGTSSAAPVMSATAAGTTTNVRGPAAFVRLRSAAPTVFARVYGVTVLVPRAAPDLEVEATQTAAATTQVAVLLHELEVTAAQTAEVTTQSVTVVHGAATATAGQTAAATTQTATLVNLAALTASQTATAATQVATLVNLAAITASQTAAVTTQTATLINLAALTASQTADATTQVATLAAVATLTAAQTADDTTQVATMNHGGAEVAAAQTADATTQVSTLTVTALLAAAQTAAATTQVATLTVAATLAAAQTAEVTTQVATLVQEDADLTVAAAQTAAPTTQAATLEVEATLAAAQTADDTTQIATLSRPDERTITAAQTAAATSQAATLTVRALVTAAQAAEATTQAATLAAQAVITAAQTAAATTQIAELARPVFGLAANQTAAATTQSATLLTISAIAAAQVAAETSQVATLLVPLTISADQLAAVTTQLARLALNLPFERNERTFNVRAIQDRTFSVGSVDRRVAVGSPERTFSAIAPSNRTITVKD